jgi:hypothetical protein
MKMRIFIVVIMLASHLGCTMVHLERNAPGIDEIEKPPEDIEFEALVTPQDPGEHYLLLSPGPFVGFGWGVPREGASLTEQVAFGLDLTLDYGQLENSHKEDQYFIWSRWSVGMNFGLGGVLRQQTGAVLWYLEAQGRYSMFGLGAGYCGQDYPEDTYHGMQITLFAGPLFFRSSYLFRIGAEVLLGLAVKIPISFVWSR